MAIKGKRKPQKRGRPAPATRPRPATARPPASTRVPFYRTFRGQLTTLIVVLALIGAGVWFFSERSADAERLSRRQGVLDAYTSEVRDLLDDAREAIQELGGAPADGGADPVHDGYLAQGSKRWVEVFQTAGGAASALTSPEGLQPTSAVLMEAFQVYTSAARSFGNAAAFAGEDPAERKDHAGATQGFLDRAAEQRDAANRLIVAVIQSLDDARAAAEMRASELQAPGALPPIAPSEATSGADQDTGSKRKDKDE